MKRLVRFVVFKPKTVILIVAAVTLLAALSILLRGVQFDGSVETLTQTGEALAFHREVSRSFGDDRVIVAAITTDDVFTSRFIQKLDRLTRLIGATAGVADAQSLTNVRSVKRDGDNVVVDRLITTSATDAQLQSLKAEIINDALYARNFISTDGRTAAINIFLNPRNEAESRLLADRVETLVTAEAAGDEVLLAGAPVMDTRGIRSMGRDMLVLSPVAALLCVAVFAIAFRSLWGAGIAMISLITGLVWVIGLMSALGRPITIATVSLPTILIAVGGSYLFHLMNQCRLSVRDQCYDTQQALRADLSKGLEFIIPPVIVSGLTTVAGFGSLGYSAIPTVRDMGLFNAAGVMAMLLVVIILVPAALSILPQKHWLGGREVSQKRNRLLERTLKTVTGLILHRSRFIWVTVISFTVLAVTGSFQVKVDTDYLHIFPKSSETVQSAEKLHQRLSGAATVNIVVTGPSGSLTEPGYLKAVESLQEFSRQQPGVDYSLSIVDVIKRLNAILSRTTIDKGSIPDNREATDAIFRDFLSEEQSVSRLINSGSRSIILLRTHLFSSSELKLLKTRIDDWAERNLPKDLSARITGSAVLLTESSDALARSQISSLAIALLTIYIMMVVLFRSFRTALIALAPNLIPIVGYFGFLGWTGIWLDIVTSLIATAALGLAVDNAVHMIRRYQRCSASANNRGWALWLTMSQTGGPMIQVNGMLVGAFLLFTLSSFVPVRTGGLLWAVTITACLLANLIFLPVLIRATERSRLTVEADTTIAGAQKVGGEVRVPDGQANA